MNRTKFERLSGQLEDAGGNRYTVDLDVTVKELFGNESSAPVARAIARMGFSANAEVDDGSYTLRYVFDGKEQQSQVRVKFGTLLGG